MTTEWWCHGCNAGGTTDREAERHVKATGHATTTSTRPGGTVKP